ncbi:MAG: hypothetical protein KBS65_06900, partial [Prevotella sp.]|nr:hypothetical protein [Candidatus Equicola stercoris]
RLCPLRKNLEPSWMAWIEVYDCWKLTCIKAYTYIHNLVRGKIFSARVENILRGLKLFTHKIHVVRNL